MCFMIKNKKVIVILAVIVIILVVVVIYNKKVNNSIKVVEEAIIIENLPDEFKDFKILQITDLHSKEFGEDNIYLINLINSIDYDIIIFTGDMANTGEENYSAFYNLVKGIDRKSVV